MQCLFEVEDPCSGRVWEYALAWCSWMSKEKGNQMKLVEWLREAEKPWVAPLMGYPGARMTGTTLQVNVQDAEFHAESILKLHETFSPDCIFPMMDLAVEAGAMGLPIRFGENESPTVECHPVKSKEDLRLLEATDAFADKRLASFVETTRVLRQTIDTALGTYVTGPFTLAGLMMGATQAAVATLRNPALLHQVLMFASEVIIGYAERLEEAGADMIVILEPTAVMLSPKAFGEFSGRYVANMVERIGVTPILHVCGNTTPLIGEMCKTGVEGLSLDAVVDFPGIARTIPSDVALIGNINPVSVMASGKPEDVRREVRRLVDGMKPYPNFILSTGCDLPFETPIENIRAFMDEGRT